MNVLKMKAYNGHVLQKIIRELQHFILTCFPDPADWPSLWHLTKRDRVKQLTKNIRMFLLREGSVSITTVAQ